MWRVTNFLSPQTLSQSTRWLSSQPKDVWFGRFLATNLSDIGDL